MNFRQEDETALTGSHCQGFIPKNDFNWLRSELVSDSDKKYPLIYSTLKFPFDAETTIIDINGCLHFWIIGGRQEVDYPGAFIENSSIALNISNWKHNFTDGIYHDYWLKSPAFNVVCTICVHFSLINRVSFLLF